MLDQAAIAHSFLATSKLQFSPSWGGIMLISCPCTTLVLWPTSTGWLNKARPSITPNYSRSLLLAGSTAPFSQLRQHVVMGPWRGAVSGLPAISQQWSSNQGPNTAGRFRFPRWGAFSSLMVHHGNPLSRDLPWAKRRQWFMMRTLAIRSFGESPLSVESELPKERLNVVWKNILMIIRTGFTQYVSFWDFATVCIPSMMTFSWLSVCNMFFSCEINRDLKKNSETL